MRIISAPVSTAPVQPVRASNAAENRTHRHQAVSEATALNKPAERSDISVADNGRRQLWENQGTIGAGVTAQRVFHAVYGGRPEASLTEANRAYTKTDELRFREAQFSLRLI